MKKIFLSLLLMFSILFTFTIAKDNPRAVIIFDASGSMWGQIHGVTKLEIARNALKNVVQEWNPNVELGLTVYGHRKKGDCNDIESVIPVGKVDKSRVIQTVMGIQPKGKTPISRSLRKVAEEIKYTEEKATIILISDGKETCDPDPCGTAKELKSQGIDFVTHVIGFNVDKNTDKQLECIAHATGGEYFSAKNAKALNKAMKVIVRKVEKPKPVVLKPTTLELMAKYKTLGKNSLPLSGAEWKVVQNNQVLFNDKTISHPKLTLESGKASIEMVYPYGSKAQKSAGSIDIKPNQNNSVIVYVDNGVVNITASETTAGKLVAGSFSVYPVVDGAPSKEGSFVCTSSRTLKCERALVVGEYLVKASYNLFKVEKKFSLMSGEQKGVHIVFKPTSTVEVTASEKEGGKWVDASCITHKIIEGKVDESDYWNIYNMSKKQAGSRQLPVGKYEVKCTYNEFVRKVPFELKAGEVTKVHVVFEQFIIESKCTDMNAKISYEIYANNGRMVYNKTMTCSKPLQLSLNVGDYSVEAKIVNDIKVKKFTIGSGDRKLFIDMTRMKKEESKEVFIEADNKTIEIKQENTHTNQDDPQKALEALGKMFGGMSEHVESKDAKDLEKAGAFFEALGGLMSGEQTKEQKEASQKAKIEQEQNNEKADKAFDEMSQELEMFSK